MAAAQRKANLMAWHGGGVAASAASSAGGGGDGNGINGSVAKNNGVCG